MDVLPNDIAAIGGALTEDAGHGGCAGWWFDPGTGLFACACGESLFKLAPVGAPA